jgi:pimeloyl-ACP methyl ester carboxylesterase
MSRGHEDPLAGTATIGNEIRRKWLNRWVRGVGKMHRLHWGTSMGKTLCYVSARTLIAAAGCLIFIGAWAASAPTDERFRADPIPSESYTHPGDLIAVEGKRRLNLLCIGSGSPVVLFDAGAGVDMMTWRHVQGRIGRLTRSCAYDRAGYGFSDLPKGMSDASNAAEDIHRLLQVASIPVPIVYVAHSGAGIYGSLLERLHPSDIAGAVFVDPAVPYIWKLQVQALSPAGRIEFLKPAAWVGQIKDCLDAAKMGQLSNPKNDQQKQCAYPSWYPEDLDPVLRAELTRRYAGPKNWNARKLEFDSILPSDGALSRDDTEIPQGAVSFGSKPVIVLNRDQWFDPDDSMSPTDQLRAFTAWIEASAALARSSRRGRQVVVSNTGHFIMISQPAVVADAVKRIVDQVRRDEHRKAE